MRHAWALGLMLLGCSDAKSSRRPDAEPTADARDLFASTCAKCHGADGTGGLPQDGGPAPRNFHDPEFQATHTDAQIVATIVNGKGTVMPAFGAAFSESQLADIVSVVRSFDPKRKHP
jgi:mono/diheme cytochrome c family protein